MASPLPGFKTLLALGVAVALQGRGAAARAAEPTTVYLNFSDGSESLEIAAEDDATTNRSATGVASPYPAFRWPSITTGVTTQAEVVRRVVKRVHEMFLPYNVLVTTTRPAAGRYVMVMIGGSARDIGINLGVAGLAYQDCDNQVASDIVFAFPDMLRGSEHGLSVTIAQESAHALGLEHTANRIDLMYPTVVAEQERFPDEESQVFGERLCGTATQNSHLRMLAAVGPWLGDEKPIDDGTRADRQPPTLRVSDPEPGRQVDQPFTLRVEAEDEGGIDHVVLAAGEDRATLYRPPFAWSLSGFPAGPLPVTVTAYDASGNTSVETATYELRAAPAALGGGCGVAPRSAFASAFASAGSGPLAPLGLIWLGVFWACIRRARPL